jgi:AcrR family transcriptional regulator
VVAHRAYGGVPAEQRRAQRRAALIAAALDIVGSPGHARLTVAGLCARADLNERYFYESFGTLDDVVVAVFEAVIAELADVIVGAVAAAPADSREKARAAIGAAVELLTDDSRKARVVFVEPLANPVLMARRADVARTFVALIVEQAQQFYGAEATLRLGSWADFAAAYSLGGLAETMTAWLRGDLQIERDELVDRATELFVLVAEHLVGDQDDTIRAGRRTARRGRPRTGG